MGNKIVTKWDSYDTEKDIPDEWVHSSEEKKALVMLARYVGGMGGILTLSVAFISYLMWLPGTQPNANDPTDPGRMCLALLGPGVVLAIIGQIGFATRIHEWGE